MRLVLFVFLLTGSVRGKGVADTAVDASDKQVAPQDGQDREGKFFPVVKLVSFDNSPCKTSSGLVGTCYSEKECDGMYGESNGECAKGYGVCCVFTATCDDHISKNNTYFKSPEHPTSGMCMVQLYPPKGTVQIKLEFLTFTLMPPVDGDCGNDTFMVTGINPGSRIPILCGENSGKHIFVDVDYAKGPIKLVFTTTGMSYSRKWNIKVSFLSDYDHCKAPPRCLEYHTDVSGTLTSFNQGMNAQLLNDLKYSICFGYIPGFCDIGLTFKTFDLGVDDSGTCIGDMIGVGGTSLCGTFTDFTIQVNATGPIVLSVMTDGDNSLQQTGFTGSYMFLPCDSPMSSLHTYG